MKTNSGSLAQTKQSKTTIKPFIHELKQKTSRLQDIFQTLHMNPNENIGSNDYKSGT